DRTVRGVLRADREGAVRFATLQGADAAAVRARHPELEGVDSLVLVEADPGGGERVSVRSEALVRLARWLPWPWRVPAALLRLVPRALRDRAYDAFARRRYRIFGRYDACPIPPPEVRARFLDLDEPGGKVEG
ncbi:MAG TPA: DCC1-like thiol-disulfide oxidoreductase family protein, partial [Longimicrobiales bacterium]|nr:DCC1-like thiol-disulfide oxidoreductase family protein [Longimicrobiales bacterium]